MKRAGERQYTHIIWVVIVKRQVLSSDEQEERVPKAEHDNGKHNHKGDNIQGDDEEYENCQEHTNSSESFCTLPYALLTYQTWPVVCSRL